VQLSALKQNRTFSVEFIVREIISQTKFNNPPSLPFCFSIYLTFTILDDKSFPVYMLLLSLPIMSFFWSPRATRGLLVPYFLFTIYSHPFFLHGFVH